MKIGIVTSDKSSSVVLGSLKLPSGGSKRLAKSHTPRPEIVHVFRVPDKRPSELVAYAFTAAVVAPLLVLLARWRHLSVNIQVSSMTATVDEARQFDCAWSSFSEPRSTLLTLEVMTSGVGTSSSQQDGLF